MLMKDIYIHILRNSKALNQQRTKVRQIIRNNIAKVDRVLPLSNLDIVVIDGLDFMKPEHKGVTGLTYYDAQVFLMLKTDDTDFPDNIDRARLLKLLAHELHHVIRGRTAKDETLFEMSITEGLGLHFENEVLKNPTKPMRDRFKNISIDNLLESSNLHDKKFEYSDYVDWFRGSKKRGIPPKAGYAMGYEIVNRYLYDNQGTKPSQLVNLPAEKFKPYLPTK